MDKETWDGNVSKEQDFGLAQAIEQDFGQQEG